MTKKRSVEDSELEQVTGAGGIMDPPDAAKKLAVASNPDSGNPDLDTLDADLSNDMILTDEERG